MCVFELKYDCTPLMRTMFVCVCTALYVGRWQTRGYNLIHLICNLNVLSAMSVDTMCVGLPMVSDGFNANAMLKFMYIPIRKT